MGWPNFEDDHWAWQQAKYELGPEAPIRSIVIRAQTLKESLREHQVHGAGTRVED